MKRKRYTETTQGIGTQMQEKKLMHKEVEEGMYTQKKKVQMKKITRYTRYPWRWKVGIDRERVCGLPMYDDLD